jgi:catechol 2,3-dioxygenase-like lactoylglutathione lyase family enzyme
MHCAVAATIERGKSTDFAGLWQRQFEGRLVRGINGYRNFSMIVDSPITGLDHVVVLVDDITAAAAAYQILFARTPAWRDSSDGADRVLFTLDNTTLELMAPADDSANANRIRAVLGEQGEGLASLCFRTRDIGKMHRRLERLTLQPTPVADAQSVDGASGATLSWKRTRAATEMTRGIRLFFVELEKERPLSVRTVPASITAMDHVVIGTADPERATALYGARLGLDMALDRSHPEWGRLMFFRCGDLIVEISHRPGKEPVDAPDKLRGVCWRVADIEATRARLVEAGVDVSEARSGRKPGTKVMTVRNGTCGVPTLLMERTPRSP